MFFTLSGFLITTLLLDEAGRGSGIALRSFWARRFRRLTPAAVTTLAAVCIVGLAGGWSGSQVAGLRTEVPAALLNAANWGFILSERSYAALFSDPSPIHHFWSLAIEEQLYLVIPLFVLAIVRLVPARRWMYATVMAIPAAASVLWGWWLAGRSDLDRAYLGTDVRAAELVIGAVLAVVVFQRHRVDSPRLARAADAAGWIALAALGLAWWGVDLLDPVLFRGGLALHALVVCLIIVAVLQSGTLGRFLGARPLVALGRISYGVYLIHWPVHVLLTPERTGLPLAVTAVARAVVTVGLALVSYRLVEQPLRRPAPGSIARRLGPAMVGATALVLLVATPLVAPADAHDDAAPFTSTIPDPITTTTLPAGGEHRPAPPAPEPLRILIVGDSVANGLASSMYRAADATRVQIIDGTASGCGTIREGEASMLGQWQPFTAACGAWESKAARYRPDVVFIQRMLADLGDHRFGRRLTNPGQPEYDEPWRAQMAADVRTARSGGATVILGTPTRLARGFAGEYSSDRRFDALVADHRAVGAAESVEVVDTQAELDAAGVRTRTDGVHLSAADSDAVAARILPRLEAAAAAARAAAGTPRPEPTSPGEFVERPLLLVGPSGLAPLAEALRARGLRVDAVLTECPLSDADARPECVERERRVRAWLDAPGRGVAVVVAPLSATRWPGVPQLGAVNSTAWWLRTLAGPDITTIVVPGYEPLVGEPAMPRLREMVSEIVTGNGMTLVELEPSSGAEGWADVLYRAVWAGSNR